MDQIGSTVILSNLDKQLEEGLEYFGRRNIFLFMINLSIVYILMTKTIGPRYMSTRKPYSLKYGLRLYNILMIILNVFSVHLYAKYFFYPGKETKWDRFCHLKGFYYGHVPMMLYGSIKILDLFETGCMVLRKKQSQITFLHVFHHSIMVVSVWHIILFFQTPPCGYIMASMNNVVHSVMHLYYLLATFGPQVQKYLWWKKYLTQLQILQFLVVLVLLVGTEAQQCKMDPLFRNIWLAIVTAVLVLFINFYLKTYK